MRPTFPGPEGVGFRCEFCGVPFSDLASLHRHLLAAHAGRPFRPTCEACGLAFDTPGELKEHNQAVHHAPRS
ncbi:MAG TPA: C2H2-type zinc finger protein [Thermoplasmata archaeon]|nr:C2H2-type zinc finger protein [Thermoplasmata archaeon]